MENLNKNSYIVLNCLFIHKKKNKLLYLLVSIYLKKLENERKKCFSDLIIEEIKTLNFIDE